MNLKVAAETNVAPVPGSVPIVVKKSEDGAQPDKPFQQGARSIIDPDLRHRAVCEAAYALYVQRGYADGFALDDWLAAEVQIDGVIERNAERPS